MKIKKPKKLTEVQKLREQVATLTAEKNENLEGWRSDRKIIEKLEALLFRPRSERDMYFNAREGKQDLFVEVSNLLGRNAARVSEVESKSESIELLKNVIRWQINPLMTVEPIKCFDCLQNREHIRTPYCAK